MTTRDDLVGLLRSRLSEGDTEFFDDTAVTRFLNESQRRLVSDAPWLVRVSYESELVTGQAIYQLPDEVIQAVRTRIQTTSGGWYPATYDDPDTLDELSSYRTTGNGGRPWRVTYRISGRGIALELYPAPSARLAVVVDANIAPGALVNGTDVCDLPDWATTVLVDCAEWLCKKKDEETAQARDAQQTYETHLADLRSTRMRKQADALNRTRGWFGFSRSRWP